MRLRPLGLGVVIVLRKVFHGQAPAGVLGARLGTTLGARFNLVVGLKLLQSTRLFETPMPSLFHRRAPVGLIATAVTGHTVYRREVP